MINRVKQLPRNAQYLYSVDDISGYVNKLYRSKSKRRLYLVTHDGILSITPKYCQDLSNKILDAYAEIRSEQVKGEAFEQ